jgi:hypothetical protein
LLIVGTKTVEKAFSILAKRKNKSKNLQNANLFFIKHEIKSAKNKF